MKSYVKDDGYFVGFQNGINDYTISKHFQDFKNLIKELKNTITINDAVYLKASRSMKFEDIISKI